jgi:hypothetical protein
VKVSRGQFLTTCGAALLGAGLDAPSLADASVAVEPRAGVARARFARFDIDHARAIDFRPHVSSVLDVRAPADPASPRRLTLMDVVERTGDSRLEQFSVVFAGPASAPLTDGIHQCRHPRLGRFDLFIVAIGRRDGGRARYEACFSRHVGSKS